MQWLQAALHTPTATDKSHLGQLSSTGSPVVHTHHSPVGSSLPWTLLFPSVNWGAGEAPIFQEVRSGKQYQCSAHSRCTQMIVPALPWWQSLLESPVPHTHFCSINFY